MFFEAIEEVDDKLADPSDPTSNVLEVKFARAKKRKSILFKKSDLQPNFSKIS